MKKISAVFLAFLMIFSSAAIPALADETMIVINAPADVTKTNGKVTEGIDYHDVAGQVYGANFYTVRNLIGKDHLALHDGDWVRYSVSDFSPGKYKVVMTYLPGYLKADGKTYPSTMTFELDGEEVLSKLLPFNSSEQTTELGEITIGENSSYLILKMASDAKVPAQYISQISFEKLVEPTFVSFDAKGKDGDYVARGADCFEILLGTNLDTYSVTNSTIKIQNENENVLLADVSAKDNIITVKLKETLLYESAYTIYIDGIKSDKGVALGSPIEEIFYTKDKDDDEGKAEIEVTSFVKEGNNINVEGVLYSSCDLGIKGREVLLSDIDDANNTVLNEKTVTTNEDGAFAFNYTLSDDSNVNKHRISVTSDYVETPYINYAFYLTEDVSIQIKEDLSGLASLQDAETEISKYIDYMDIDMAEAGTVINDFDKVYEKMLDKTFDSADSAMDCFKQAVYFEWIAQAENAQDIVSVLDNKQKAQYITGFSYELWNILNDDNKVLIAESIIDKDFEDSKDMQEILNEAVEDKLIGQFGYGIAEVSVTSDSVLSGETAKIILKTNTVLNDVLKMHLEFAYDEKSNVFFENEKISVDSNGKFESEIKSEENVLSIDLTAKSVQSVSGDFLTIKIPATAKMVGTHNATMSGYVLYHPEEITDKDTHLKENINAKNEVSVNVKEVTYLEKGCRDVLMGGDGTGYFDAGGKGDLEGGGSAYPNVVVMRVGDWQAYDISALSAGMYELVFEGGISLDTEFTVSIDGDAQIVNKIVKTTGGYTTFKDAILGKIELGGEQKVLKFALTGANPTYANKLKITKVYPLKEEKFTSNLGDLINGKISRGSDSFTVSFNNELTAIEYDVSIKDNSGKTILCSANSSGKNITVNLKETLDYNKEYTLKIKNVTDIYGQTAKEYEKTFKTEGEDVVLGIGAIDVESVKIEGTKLSISGVLLSSCGEGIKGRKVKVLGKSSQADSFTLWDEGLSKDDGQFTLSYTFDNNADNGKYDLSMEAEYVVNPVSENVYFYQKALSESLASEFSNLKDDNAVLEKLREKEADLGINLSDYEEYLQDIASGMANKEYESGTEVTEEIITRYALETVNNAENADRVLDIINSGELNVIGKIQKEKWDLLENSEKEKVAKAIFDTETIKNPEDLISLIDEEINKIIAERNGLLGATLKVTSPKVTVGQSAELKFSVNEKQENVKNVLVEVIYGENKALFENDSDVILSDVLKNTTIKTTKEKGKVTYEISSLTPIAVSGEIMTVSFLAEKGTEGTYNPVIKGYITYYLPEDKNGLNADVPFYVESAPSITITAQSTSQDRPTGGGNGYREPSGGGSSHGGGSTGNVNSYSDIKTTTDIKVIFTDIEHVAWAKESIISLAKKGILSGRGDGTFAPDDNVTRGEFCKMITLAFGIYDKAYECSFKDVSKDAWYYSYIASAKACGLVNGRDDGSFGANDTITREEMAAIALRAIKSSKASEAEKFVDDSEISSYAKDAVYTLKSLGVMDGVGNNMFAPKESVTRAMAAKVINMLGTV